MEVAVRIPGPALTTSPERIAVAVRRTEPLRSDSVCVSGHVIPPEQVDSRDPYPTGNRRSYPADTVWLNPLLPLQRAIAASPGVKLGTPVLVAPLRHRVLLAKQLATLDFYSTWFQSTAI